MNDVNSSDEESTPIQDLKAELEMMYIGEYLHEKGYSAKDLNALPEQRAAKLMTEASQYASLKLAELEARAHMRTRIHNVSDS